MHSAGLQQSLAMAIRDCDYDAVEQLIRDGADVNAAPVSGVAYLALPALLRASMVGDARLCQLLIAAGADVELKGMRGASPLYQAAQDGFLDVCKVLVAAGADVDGPNDAGQTPLFAATRKGRAGVLHWLISVGANPHVRDSTNTTLMHLAVAGGSLEICRALLDAGVSPKVAAQVLVPPDSRDDWRSVPLNNLTPLHIAVSRDSSELCRLLVAHGADPAYMPEREFDRYYLSPVQQAIKQRQLDSARFLILECDVDFGQLTVDYKRESLSKLADGAPTIREWLRVAETQQAVRRAVDSTAEQPPSESKRRPASPSL